MLVIHNRTAPVFATDDTSKHVVPSTVCPEIEFANDMLFIFLLSIVVYKNFAVVEDVDVSLFFKVTSSHLAYNVPFAVNPVKLASDVLYPVAFIYCVPPVAADVL